MVQYLKARPMLLCTVFTALVCAVGFYWESAATAGLLFITAAFVFLLLRKAKPSSFFVLFLLVLVCLSLLLTQAAVRRVRAFDKTTVSGSFLISETPLSHGKFESVTVTVKHAPPLEIGDKILIRGKLSAYRAGNLISAKLRLKQVNADYARTRYSEGVYIEGNAKDISLLKEDGNPLLRGVSRLRAAIEDRLFASMPEAEAATLSAVLIGDKTHLDAAFKELVTAAGVNHIMVVSGLHLAIIMTLLLRLTRFVTNAPVVRFLIILGAAAFLTVLCGFTKSILRASLCLILYGVSLLLGRKHTPENTLGGAVVLLLLSSPFLIFSVSFQLSVLSTLGILTVALPLLRIAGEKRLFKNPLVNFAVSAVLVTGSATGFALPVTLFIFGGFSAVGLLSNLLLVPVMTPMLMLAAVLLAVSLPVPSLAPLTLWAPGLLASYVTGTIALLGRLPFSYIYTNEFENCLSVFVPFLLFFTSLLLQKRAKQSRKPVCGGQNP